MQRFRFLVIGFVVAGLAGCFLPWAETLHFEASNHINGLCFAEGGYALASFLMIGILSVIRIKAEPDFNSYSKATLGLGLITAVVIIFRLLEIQSQFATLTEYDINIARITRYHPAYGLHVSLAAALSIVLMMAGRLVIRVKNIFLPNIGLRGKYKRQFYLPTHHTTSL